jgi:hypothetical protein
MFCTRSVRQLRDGLIELLEAAFSMLFVPRCYKQDKSRVRSEWSYPCGGGVEYLHRDPGKHRRRRKGKSQILDSKIRLRVPRKSDPRKTALARASSIYKRQTRPLVREGSPQKQDRKCQTVINMLDTKTYWMTERQSQFDFDIEFTCERVAGQ